MGTQAERKWPGMEKTCKRCNADPVVKERYSYTVSAQYKHTELLSGFEPIQSCQTQTETKAATTRVAGQPSWLLTSMQPVQPR